MKRKKLVMAGDRQSHLLTLAHNLTRAAGSLAAAALLLTALALTATSGETRGLVKPQPREGHALWAHPPDVGKTAESVREFVAKCKRANIDTIVMDIKGMNGEVYWRSKKFPQAIAKGYESFDVLEHLTREAHAQGIKVDAWLVDFAEGERGAAFREHPEWACLSRRTTTGDENSGAGQATLSYVWMCRRQRPGYTDQWLP